VNSEPLTKVGPVTAAEICARYTAPFGVVRCLRDGMGARELVEVLVEQKEYTDAIDFLARALPPREGVWWSGLCMQHACGDSLNPHERTAGIAAIRWVVYPSEENRDAARAPGEALGTVSPAGPLALAAAGGIHPIPYAAAETVAMSIKLSSLRLPAERMLEGLRVYVELGIGVAEGKFA
jgi:hypothetical protein